MQFRRFVVLPLRRHEGLIRLTNYEPEPNDERRLFTTLQPAATGGRDGWLRCDEPPVRALLLSLADAAWQLLLTSSFRSSAFVLRQRATAALTRAQS